MKITILANQDIASNYAINMLLGLLVNHDVSLFLSSQVGSNNNKPKPLISLKAIEQQMFTETLSVLLDGELSHKAKFKSFEGLSKQLCSPVSILNNINTAEGIEKLKQTDPELIISIRYGIILKDAIIDIPRFGVINLHSGLLPAYRGVMATFWAMLNGDKTIGCTLHYIDNSRIDTGRTIAVTALTVDQKRSYLWHVLTLYEQGVEEIAKTVKKIADQDPIDSSAQRSGGHYYTFPTSQDLQNFDSKGLVLADKLEILAFFNTRYLLTD
jgi:methionyl-tRNA formyltransferase